eukprot:CAMPEP_0170490040 /NCGR_PEP_ID=MMETSP0208-20121228/8314_1 /TAXON_ID=197538 /ORGANISM="Strombidium inclinatum, Strain S3" /LENGTH=45 /DNA_ID= /DNA_START= /DNA_END= /DNA_ORIENTATION=
MTATAKNLGFGKKKPIIKEPSPTEGNDSPALRKKSSSKKQSVSAL